MHGADCAALLYELLVVELWLVVASLKNMCFVQFRSRSRSSMQCVMENHKMYKAVLKNYDNIPSTPIQNHFLALIRLITLIYMPYSKSNTSS